MSASDDAATPAWLELRRVVGSGGRAQPPPPALGKVGELPIPKLPPHPPTDRMRPVRIRRNELRTRWISSASGRLPVILSTPESYGKSW